MTTPRASVWVRAYAKSAHGSLQLRYGHGDGLYVQYAKSFFFFATGAKKPCCATGFESNKKSSTVPGRSCHFCKDALVYKLLRLMPTQGPSSKFGLCPRGLINTVRYSIAVICSWVASLSTREGASGGLLLFSWFGEERKGNACCVWVWGTRSQIQRTKNQRFSTKFDQNTPDLKTSSGYG